MPAMYVEACVKRGTSDAFDANAICEAVTCPTMRFVAVWNEVLPQHLSYARRLVIV